MKKNALRSKLTEMISNIDELISCTNEQTLALSELARCQGELKTLLKDVEAQREGVDARTVTMGMYRLIGCLYSWFAKSRG